MLQNSLQKHPKKIKLFLQSIKSEETKRNYIIYLQKYLQFPGAIKIIAYSNPRKIEDHIISFVISMKEQSKSYSAIHNYISAVIKFYTINDVVLNSSKIYRFMPDNRKSNKDKAYDPEDILKLVDTADQRMKAVILLLSSTGMRIGAIPGLRLRNLERIEIENFSIYKITVYENDKEEHCTYCTSECAAAIDNYLAMRKRYGEKFFPNSFLIREQFDIRDPFAISKCQKTVANTLVNKIIDLAIHSGIRKKEVLEEGKKHLGGSLRKEVAICHGFRKFFTTKLINKKINPEIREMLLGHKIGLAGVYYKPTDDDFLEEYQKVIDELTIDPANRLRRTVEILKIEKSRIDKLEAKIQRLERRHR